MESTFTIIWPSTKRKGAAMWLDLRIGFGLRVLRFGPSKGFGL
tara:strand:- start:2896 stop:3024 length:129 start_codon:yes stop_codon:yes gene_type:complete